VALAKRDMQLEHPRSVFQLLRKHYSRYTPEMVASITGIPRRSVPGDRQGRRRETGKPGQGDDGRLRGRAHAPHHGGQLIRTAAILQLLLGNMGRPGGGMNAERGHANIQGNTDNAISWEILPGYLRIPAPGQKNLDDYVTQSAPKKFDANSWNFFGTNYRKFMVSLLKTWYGDAATDKNEYAFDFIPKPSTNSSWISIYDQALKKKMEGVILSGMTATSIGPDANQVMQALANLKWLAVMDPAADDQLGVLAAAGRGSEVDPDRSLHGPEHALDREGRLVREQRPLDAVEGGGRSARGRPPRPLGPGRGLPRGARSCTRSRAASSRHR
jgi:formate dehydrogenase major subunit